MVAPLHGAGRDASLMAAADGARAISVTFQPDWDRAGDRGSADGGLLRGGSARADPAPRAGVVPRGALHPAGPHQPRRRNRLGTARHASPTSSSGSLAREARRDRLSAPVIWNPAAETMPRAELERLQLERLRETLAWAERARAVLPGRGSPRPAWCPRRSRAWPTWRASRSRSKDDLRQHYPVGPLRRARCEAWPAFTRRRAPAASPRWSATPSGISSSGARSWRGRWRPRARCPAT